MEKFGKWTEAYTKLSKADQEHSLSPDDLVTYAIAAYLTGRDAEGYEILERVHLTYLKQNSIEQAVRYAFWLGLMLMNSGERARANGWFARGERLISDRQVSDCAEKGLLLIPLALGRLAAGDPSKAQELFERAAEIGEQFDDPDVVSLARLGLGQSMIQRGNVAKGITLLDETMIALETEKVFPLVQGIVYCAAIETCRKVWDLGRAHEWTSALTRWCDTHPDMIPFRGQCLVSRAEIIQFHGEWKQALEETIDACALLARPPGGPAAGEAYYRKAELMRLLGHFGEAERDYEEAAKRGKKPLPGLALLRLAQGQNDAAETTIRNALRETKDITRRADILPALVRITISLGRTEEAGDACSELFDIAKQCDSPYLLAISSYCQGAVLLSEGSANLALEHLQRALTVWNRLHLPYESAHTRELEGIAYRELKDKDNSDISFAAAKWVFEQLNAIPDVERINRLMDTKKQHPTHGLSLREVQVLRKVATGKTNKLIADELFISERTVDRHVSNIFNKLGVASRAEATAFAFKNKILDNDFTKH